MTAPQPQGPRPKATPFFYRWFGVVSLLAAHSAHRSTSRVIVPEAVTTTALTCTFHRPAFARLAHLPMGCLLMEPSRSRPRRSEVGGGEHVITLRTCRRAAGEAVATPRATSGCPPGPSTWSTTLPARRESRFGTCSLGSPIASIGRLGRFRPWVFFAPTNPAHFGVEAALPALLSRYSAPDTPTRCRAQLRRRGTRESSTGESRRTSASWGWGRRAREGQASSRTRCRGERGSRSTRYVLLPGWGRSRRGEKRWRGRCPRPEGGYRPNIFTNI